ncbi:hypothetical protein EPUS_06749 [Endocarpon pusillum Z07020]|uniref:Uncharacterized protein n=1 Tax=Endocarpon pusillum (strain Z07020 / HMAS-L-300199) TaxID=1263415 RepID=U1HPH8_ENDPU|nr:uncharacterized protein EPUS_06749 [Endocarpon pusillum Z07020]ERF70964.1 hypothetical protein EPUS_06749 [Endocarpon pusillum Z07020]
MQSSTTNSTMFNDQMTSGQDWVDQILQFTGSLFDREPMLVQDWQQETTITDFDHFEKEIGEIINQTAQNNSPGSEVSEVRPQNSLPWAHSVVMQEGGIDVSIPTTSVRINRTGRRPTLSDPTHTRQTPSQRHTSSTGSHRSLRFRGTWSSLPTRVDVHHTDHSEVGFPNWPSEIIDEPAASMFDDDESTLENYSVGENGL